MRRISPLERLRLFGRAGIDVVATLGRSVLFLVNALFGRSRAGKPFQLLIKQLFAVGVMSLAIIVVSGIFIGMVLPCRATTFWSAMAPSRLWGRWSP